MSDEFKQFLEELESRAEENREKAQKYDGEKEAWFKGIATGYEGAIEEICDQIMVESKE